MPKYKAMPPLEELRKRFSYDPESGLFNGGGMNSGILMPCGHLRLEFARGDFYQAHRVAWYLETGVDPGDQVVEHRDRNPSNNRFSNLRLATQLQNCQNRVAQGFCWEESRQRYRVEMRIWGKKRFIGRFRTVEEAQAAYDAKAVELRGEYAAQECLRRVSQ